VPVDVPRSLLGTLIQELQNLNPNLAMILRLFLLGLLSAALTSCSSYQLASNQGLDHPCYSTWHPLPRNS
jgi:hypothetical protein